MTARRHGTLDSPLRRARTVAPDKVALIDGDLRYTYAELSDRSDRLRGGLRSLGLDPGDRIAGLALNSAAHFEAWTAIPTADLVFNDLNVRLATPELEFIVNDSGARALAVDARHWDRALVLRELCPSLELLIWMDRGPAPDGAVASWDDLAAHEPSPVPDEVDADSIAGLVYTGGTTGLPKGVVQTHGNLIANAKHMLWANPLSFDDRFLHLTPMFHAAGVANIYSTTFVAGTHIICPGFDADLVGRMIETDRITICVLVPTMLNMFLNHPATAERDLSSWRLCLYAASPIPLALLEEAMRRLPCDFFQGYGMTEMSPHCCQLAVEDHRRAIAGDADAIRRLTSAGTPSVGVDVEVRRADDSRCSAGEVGEVTVRGPNMTPGYWNRPDESAAVFTVDGWYRTGDLAFMDDGGYVFIVDRAKDMIVSGGENVYTIEVENALTTHPDVLEAAVFGIPHPQWGESVHAEVVLRAGATAASEDLIAHCRAAIAGFKVPRSLALRHDPLPKSSAGKILKRELKAPFWEGHSRQVS